MLGLDPDFAPFTFESEGRCGGFVVDVLRLAAQTAGISFLLRAVSLSERAALLASGELAGWACLARTLEREKEFLFSRPLVWTSGALFFAATTGISQHKPVGELEDGVLRTIATPGAGPLVASLQALFPGAQVVMVADYREALAFVIDGKADAAALNCHAGAKVAEKWFPGQFQIAGLRFAKTPLAVALLLRADTREQADSWLDRLNRGLCSLIAEGKLARLASLWGIPEVDLGSEGGPAACAAGPQ